GRRPSVRPQFGVKKRGGILTESGGMAMNVSLSGRRVIGSLGYLLAVGLPLALAGPQDQGKAKSEEPKKPALYDTKADAQAQVEAATAAAKRDHSRVLVMFGL